MPIYFEKIISRKKSEKMILDMAKHSFSGRGFYGSREEVRIGVEKFFSEKDMDFHSIVENNRDHWNFTIPFFDDVNLYRFYAKKDEGLSLENPFYPEENREIIGPGFIIQYDYLMRYKFALDNLFLSVRYNNYFYLLSALSFGLSSIDAYINVGARRWNSLMPQDKMEDTKENPKSLEYKISN